MSDDSKLLNDIKSGKGLPPIEPASSSNPQKNGLTTENRGKDFNGLRIDTFGLNDKTKKN